ncbi:MAG: hypothetical protein AB1772_00735 [Candidatus Zixiibacteriota bacterium]
MENSLPRAEQGIRSDALALLETVDALGEQTKDLALNLALYLAKVKARKSSEKLRRMEPEFIRLVNGTVKVVQELTVILKAARHQEKMVFEPPSSDPSADRLLSRLEAIALQCSQILESLHQNRDLLG